MAAAADALPEVGSGIHRVDLLPDNLCDALRRAAAGDRGVVLVAGDGGEERRTWSELYRASLRRAAALRARGLQRGEAVVIVLDTSFDFVETFFGVMLAGGVPTPAYPPVAMARLASYVELLGHIVRATDARLLITDARIAGAIATVGREPSLRAIVDAATLDAEPDDAPAMDPWPDAPGMIQCTSGSTSAPKPVVLLQRNLMANVLGMLERYELGPDDVAVSWLPLYHDLGLIGQLFGATVGGYELVLLSPATFLLEPAAWWRAVSRHRGTITAAPNFAYGLSARRLEDEEVAALDLSHVRICACGAEPIQPDTIAAFYGRMAPSGLRPETFSPAYGLAECCVGVTGTAPLRGLRIDRVDAAAFHGEGRAVPSDAPEALRFVSVGHAFEGTRIVVRDADGHALPDRCIGEVWASGSSVMAGYLHDEAATREALRDGELRTGDLGYMVDGELFVAGRAKHVLIVRGRNYYAEAVEAVVEQVPGVRDRAQRAALEQAIARTIAEEIGLRPASIVLLQPNTIPKTSSGKKQRLRCREMLLSGRAPNRFDRALAQVAGAMTMFRSQMALQRAS